MIGIDKPMPRTCEECPCCADLEYDVICNANDGHLLSGEPYEKCRMPFCPLIDITDDGK
jgi:hypothetical protein